MTQLWLWIGFIGMTIGAVIFGSKATAMRRKEGMEFPLKSFFIVLWAAALYLSMALGQTITPLHGHDVFWGRYVDWLVTTPLLLLDLGLLAGLRPKLIAGVLGADVFMILTGLIAALSTKPTNYLWYVISTGAFVAIVLSLLTEFSASARKRNGKVNSLFQKLRNVLIVLWIGYPIVWLIGPEGFNLIAISVSTALYAILDLCAKVGFGLILTSADPQVLAQASSGVVETAHSYMEGSEHYSR